MCVAAIRAATLSQFMRRIQRLAGTLSGPKAGGVSGFIDALRSSEIQQSDCFERAGVRRSRTASSVECR
ncbi:hypothetical protein BN2476_320241 [Paraburkholderia piptadeniae]|uniref:Uncharacterized protein n=1 Tax=Paraburkholderia piptadeniae TaxID=1701573 RepID=A0A1N7S5M0_9BURK|nr:hypothetical protein BN2476_320241 [Paraburkholderia piptadeniae]